MLIRNKLDLMGGQFNGLNMNPIPLEFNQGMTTTKWLLSLLAKIDEVIGFTNGVYDEIIEDLENDGILYQKLSAEFLTSFGADITAIQGSINNINTNITNLGDLITALQYTKPNVNLSSSSSNYLYAIGEVVNSVMLNFNIVKGTNDLVKAEIYKNGSLLTTITNLLNGVNSYVDGTTITNDTTYYVKVFDNNGNVQSNELKFDFEYKAYYGKISVSGVVNDALIQSLNNNIFDNAITFNIDSLNDEKIIIVSHETLKSIIDSDNFDMIESFTLSTINLNINNTSIPYNVYVSTNTIKDNNVSLIIEK